MNDPQIQIVDGVVLCYVKIWKEAYFSVTLFSCDLLHPLFDHFVQNYRSLFDFVWYPRYCVPLLMFIVCTTIDIIGH